MTDKVFFTDFNGEISVQDVTNRSTVLSNLGYSVTDNLVSDLILLVEGPKDAHVIEEFLIKMNVWGNYNVKIWPLGGDIMGQVDLSILAERSNILALVDNDPGSRSIRDMFVANCDELKIPVVRLERYAMENYFSLRAIREVYKQWGKNFPDDIIEIKPNTKLEDQIGFSIKRNDREIAKEMTLAEIESTGDLYTFLMGVYGKCKSIS